MNALYYIVDTLTSLYLGVLILRFIMQVVRANFRNPFAEAVVRITNPLILPLRRVLPSMGRIDTASVVAIVLFAIFKVLVLSLFGGFATLVTWVFIVARTLVLAVLWLYVIMIFFYGIAGFLLQGGSSPIYELLAYCCDPLLKRIRKIIPSLIGGLDLSFLWAIILLQATIILIGEIPIPA